MTFEDFYLAAKDDCFRALVAATADLHEAEDVTAEAFARALDRWPELQHHPAPRAWVVRTALNLRTDRYRHRQRTSSVVARLPVPEVAPEPPRPVDPALLAALGALPQRQREVIAMRVLLGLSGAETARELGITTGSVGTHLHRGLAALRSRIQSDNPEVTP
jgi:RNA polymerase sigma factor (sigma-70 family)